MTCLSKLQHNSNTVTTSQQSTRHTPDKHAVTLLVDKDEDKTQDERLKGVERTSRRFALEASSGQVQTEDWMRGKF